MSARPQPGYEDPIGRSIPRVDARDKLTGRAVYTDDIDLPGMLHAAILGADHPHARILSIDISAAQALPGVKAVITGRNIETGLIGSCLKDEPPLATDKVRYVGEPVAAVAAVDAETARRAVQLIDVRYEELEPVLDIDAVLSPGAPVIHEHKQDYFCIYEMPSAPNAAGYTQFKEGSPESAWAECDVIVEGVYETPAQEHMYLEPCSTVAAPEANGKFVVWSSMQSVFRVQVLTAEALKIPMTRLRVIAPKIGGGFGGKCELTNQPIAVALAMAANAPVKLTYTRAEDMSTVKSRHACRTIMKTGAKRDGTLVAREVLMHFDTGAYADEGPEVASVGAFFARGPYRIPHINAEAWCWYTNKLKAGAFRGFGNPQVSYASELQIDEIAARLGLDPMDVRRRNALASGDLWLGGKTVKGGTLVPCIDALREACGWDAKRGGIPAPPGKKRGIGMATVAHISAMMGAGSTVRLNEDGTVTVNTGAIDIGEGADTVLTQMAASALQVPVESINYANADSDLSPYNFQTSASRTTYTVGKAVENASLQVRDKIFAHAAEILECAPGDLELRGNGVVGVQGVPDAKLPYAAIAARALYGTGGPISGHYNWIYEGDAYDPKRAIIRGFTFSGIGVFCFAAQAVEVEVDLASGQVEVVQAWSAHDVGRAINPRSVEGQVQGGFVQGLGYALTEELVWDGGRLENPSMMDYKIPGALDVPYAIQPIILEHPEEDGPWGAKGIGEIGIVGVAPAVVNAITHATGATVKTIPATPERVLDTLIAAGVEGSLD